MRALGKRNGWALGIGSVLAVAAVGAGPALAGADPGQRPRSGPTQVDAHHDVTISPDPLRPYEPMTVTVSRADCPPGAEAEAVLSIDQHATDIVVPREMARVVEPADADGAVSLELTVATAYPGSWSVATSCEDGWEDDASTRFAVALPEGFRATVVPDEVRRGETVTFAASGTECFGREVIWDVGLHPVFDLAGSRTTPGPDGRWSDTVEVTVHVDAHDGLITAGFAARCVHEDEIWVNYPGGQVRVLPAAVPPAPPATPRTGAPTFTG